MQPEVKSKLAVRSQSLIYDGAATERADFTFRQRRKPPAMIAFRRAGNLRRPIIDLFTYETSPNLP